MSDLLENKREKKPDKLRGRVLVVHIFAPIVIGAIIYYLFSPEVIFVKQIDALMGRGFHNSGIIQACFLMQFIRNHFLDMLWGYGLTFGLFYVLGNNTAVIGKAFWIAFSFSTMMELLQRTPMAKGTFDVWDIICMLLSELIAVFIIRILLQRRN